MGTILSLILHVAGGPFLGMVTSLVPELFQWLLKSRQDKADKAQQLELERIQMERDKAGLQARQDELTAQVALEEMHGDNQVRSTEAQAFLEAVRQANVPSGVKWVDAATALVRPVITYGMLALVIGCTVVWLRGGQPGAPLMPPDVWDTAGWVIGFWFGHRGLQHAKGEA